ncbi:hypothetical protein ASG14_18885 [Pedobacter sp. Leaf194]|nr:hypothetical protein ASG14_18885 [Pedobacter sp. Leaf194]
MHLNLPGEFPTSLLPAFCVLEIRIESLIFKQFRLIAILFLKAPCSCVFWRRGYFIKLNAIKIVATKRTTKPDRNTKSATCSSFLLSWRSLRMEIKDRMQLVIKNITAATANSSIKEPSVRFSFLSEVSTIKQIPNKLADVLRICGDLFSGIVNLFPLI